MVSTILGKWGLDAKTGKSDEIKTGQYSRLNKKKHILQGQEETVYSSHFLCHMLILNPDQTFFFICSGSLNEATCSTVL